MSDKDTRRLRVGVLGCGPIAQFAHFDASRKARNAELYAICDLADDLRERMNQVHRPAVAYREYDAMLADPRVEAVIVAVADAFHVPLALRAIEAGKHVLVEKPLGTTVESCRELRDRAFESRLVVQVGNNRRFDPGVDFARRFIRDELGPRVAIKAWYYDSKYRYTMTDNLQPVPVVSRQAQRPEVDPRSDRRAYYLLTHGSHLVDMARLLGGPIASVRARRLERFGCHCWFVAVDFEDGTLGQLDLQVPIRGDFEEGFRVFGEHGSVAGRLYLPWYHKASEVECFSDGDRQFRRVLGEDAHTYKRQVEAFAAAILNGEPQIGANLEDGLAAMQVLVAVARSAESGELVRPADVSGGV